ncbi:MAG: helix-turn-helix domain-containing protein [Actinobacteria bacterium]|nr:helix-turn-helix domain-containing protein [Actinomycetota bacterium]
MGDKTILADLLGRLRREAGLSMYELAKRTGLNRSVLARIEDGTTTQPDTRTLNRIARALGVDPESFYDAVWQGSQAPLPSPATYFRSKYHLTDEQIRHLEDSLQQLTQTPEGERDDERRSP